MTKIISLHFQYNSELDRLEESTSGAFITKKATEDDFYLKELSSRIIKEVLRKLKDD